MKRQSNIVAAALDNYERLDEILKISQQSAGSAMREQEEYAKSIQYSIDTLKAAYQDFADSVINSDFVKNLLGTAQSFLEVLTKIIDKFGTLPTILTSIAAVGGIKGVGIFGNLDNGLSSIKTSLADVVDGLQTLKSYKNVASIYEGFGINLRGLSEQDIASLQEYVNLISDAKPSTIDLDKAMANTTQSAKNQAKQFKNLAEQYHAGTISEEEFRMATQNLSVTQRVATVTSKALSVALNTIANVGFMIAVNAIIKGIEYIATAEERAVEAAKELRENATSASKEFDAESTTLNELVTKYSELVSSTNDVASIKSQLSSLQDELVKKYGEEAGALDLLNGKYEENIEKMNEFARNNAKKYLDENKIAIEEAESALAEVAKTTFESRNGMVGYFGGLRLGSFSKEFAEKLKSEYEQITVAQEGISKDLTVFVDGDLKTRLEIAKQIRAEYGETENYSKSLYQSINNTIQENETLYEQYKQIADEAKKSRDILYGMSAPTLENVTDSARTALSQLSEIKTETDAIGDKWFENLDEIQKGSLKTIDAMKSALQTIAGDGLLSSDEFWDLAKIDTERVLDGAQLIGNQFKVSEEQLIQLKDTYIKKQIETIKAENADLTIKKQQTDELIRQAELEVQALGRRGLSNATYRTQFEEANKQLKQAKQNSEEYGRSIERNDMLIKQFNSSLGNTVDMTEVIKKKQEELNAKLKVAQTNADEYAKAMTDAVQDVINGLESEKQQLEDEKQILDDQLDVLNERKQNIEDTIEQYKSLVSIVKDATDTEIDALKERQQAEEDAVQVRIDALKEQHDIQEEENSLAEKELELRKKLADLDKAKSTKVRTYSAERGWHFDVDKEAVATAQTAVSEAQKAYDDAISDKTYNDQIKALEAEKKAIAKNYEAEIKSYEDYYKQWSDITEEQSKAEEDQLAQQILGSDWREKIKAKDSKALAKFTSDFRGYNAQLNSLVNGEIASLKKSVEAKQEEINAKNKQIDAWKRYKTQVEDTIDNITNKYKDYTDALGVATAAEGDSYETREEKLRNFATQYESLINEINGYQSQIEGLTIPVQLDDRDAREKIGTLLDDYANAMSEMSRALEDTPRSMHKWVDDLRNIYGFSQGGVADFTGVTTVHGTKQRAETIFNASQSKELYDMVKSGSFVNVVADKAYAGLSSAISKMSSTTDNSNRVININGLTIKADNPLQFHDQFMKEIGQYWNIKLTEVRTR